MEFTSSLAFPGKRLINHLIRTVEFPVQDFCSALCFMEPKCVSYNELVASGSPVIAKCELNNSTHNEHPQDPKSWTNCRYKGTMVSTFLSYLCFSFILFNDKGYRCLCPPEYKGTNFEVKINFSFVEILLWKTLRNSLSYILMNPTVSLIQPAIPPDVWIPFCPSCFPIQLSD